MSDIKLYKVLGANAQSIHGGDSTWHKPKGHPGKWMPKIERVKCCTSGYHLVELTSLAEWLREDCTIYLAEGRGAKDSDGEGKTAYAEARLIRRLYLSEKDMRLFAADCADHVQHIWDAKYPNDHRPAIAIQAARDFANGLISVEELRGADSYAAAASYASYASYAAASYASSAASYAASYAASAYAYAASAYAYARKQEIEWQAEQLSFYLKDSK
jgi:hypothetical protein